MSARRPILAFDFLKAIWLLCPFVAFPALADLTPGSGIVPYWIEPRANRQIDAQVINILKHDAAIVTIRAQLEDRDQRYKLSQIVKEINQATSAPVLLYTWASRYRAGERRSGKIMEWLAARPDLLIRSINGKPLNSFGNVIDLRYREEAVSAISMATSNLDTDGVAIDLAIRSPIAEVKPLAERCEADAEFCGAYSLGMDALFAELRSGLGGKSIVYNGLWSFDDKTIEDQAKLLKNSDGAIVEYFGMNPREGSHSFTKDVLPYITALKDLPSDAKIFVYGRGGWTYTDYMEDYNWQRYLYCAYLLAKRPGTYFKYHASFQIPAHAGRAGGLDTYVDWRMELGEPIGSYQESDGLYTRIFSGGMVVVAPDDGPSKSFNLASGFYNPEGELLKGDVELRPGEGLLLLRGMPSINEKKSQNVDLRVLSSWSGTRWQQLSSGEGYLVLAPLEPAEYFEERDILLDTERSLDPPPILNLNLRAYSATTRVLIVAEVDDLQKEHSRVVLSLETNECRMREWRIDLPVVYKAPAGKRANGWPRYCVKGLTKNRWDLIELDGRVLLDSERYVFKRWQYIRVVGRLDIRSVRLSGE